MYLDPGLGSLVIQFFIGLLVAVPVLVATFWTKVKLILRKVFSGADTK